jgi:hypothetical protein
MCDAAPDAAAARPADQRQAEYFRRMFYQQRVCLELELNWYQKLLARYAAKASQSDIRRVTRLMRVAEKEQQTVERLIAALEARFVQPGALLGQVPGWVQHDIG